MGLSRNPMYSVWYTIELLFGEVSGSPNSEKFTLQIEEMFEFNWKLGFHKIYKNVAKIKILTFFWHTFMVSKFLIIVIFYYIQ